LSRTTVDDRDRRTAGAAIPGGTNVLEFYTRLESSLKDLSLSLDALPDPARASIAEHVSRLEQIILTGNRGRSERVAESGTCPKEQADADALFTSLFGASGDGVAIVENGAIVAVNSVLAKMFGCAADTLCGVRPIELVVPADRTSVLDASIGGDLGEPGVVEARGLRQDGSEFVIEIRHWDEADQAGRQGLIVVRDTWATRPGKAGSPDHLEELAHAQRLSTVGEMASGLAHELNQPLAAIVNYTRGCMRRLRAGNCGNDHADILDVLEKVSLQGDRAGRILQRIRGFVRKHEPRRTRVNLNDVASVAVGMTSSEAADAGAFVTLDVAASPLFVEADQTQIEQVVLNLLRNGYDALREGGRTPRRLTLRTRKDGDTASVDVVDNGPGFDPDMEERVFEPFFTTRAKGMGLGLAISRSIAEAHGGRLLARKAPGGGAALCLTLPLDQGDGDDGN